MLINNPLHRQKQENKKHPAKYANNSRLLVKLERLINRWEGAKNTDTYLFIKNPRKAIWANLIIGISRGVGFVLGVSSVGVIVTAIIGWVFSYFVTIPVIGEFIATIVKSVQEYLRNIQ